MSSGMSAAAMLRNRLPQQQASRSESSQSPRPSPSPRPSGLDRRRSSIMSFSSLDDMTQLLTDDIINPSMRRSALVKDADEVTHWHSTPLAFAILPAIGGLLFQNGSAFMTDAILLALAAIFLNWSIRLPWDWYYSAQEQLRVGENDYFSRAPVDRNDIAVDSASSMDGSPRQSPADQALPPAARNEQREVALSELRKQETMALASTFIFPVLTAYLLHVIRGQLSNSSTTNLVSDYNLSIFLLAAEIRPCRQMMRLMSRRTLHLQRTVSAFDNDSFGSAVEEKSIMLNLTSRITELEARLTDTTLMPPNVAIAKKTDVSELSAEMKKRFEPRLESLERAVRRYEKRSTTLAMLIEQRLAQLETRLQDALSLAAVAAQHSEHRGMAKLGDGIATALVWPFQIAWRIATSPLYVIEDVYIKVQGLLPGQPRGSSSKRASSRQSHTKSSNHLKDDTVLHKSGR